MRRAGMGRGGGQPCLKLGSCSCSVCESSIRLRSSSRLPSFSRMWSLLTSGQCSGKLPCRGQRARWEPPWQ